MRIENQVPRNVNQTSRPADRGAKPTGESGNDVGPSSHTASPELTALLSEVGQIPAVRSDVVANVVQRLNSGDLQSPTSIAQTADAMLGASSPSASLPVDGSSSPMSDLIAALQQLPQTRPDVVEEVSKKLGNGQLSTSEAIRGTAAAILG